MHIAQEPEARKGDLKTWESFEMVPGNPRWGRNLQGLSGETVSLNKVVVQFIFGAPQLDSLEVSVSAEQDQRWQGMEREGWRIKGSSGWPVGSVWRRRTGAAVEMIKQSGAQMGMICLSAALDLFLK